MITQLTAKDIDAYKSALQSSRLDRPKVSSPYPMTRTFVAIPVAPGVVVAYHEMQVAGLWGWGGFVWAVWWPGYTNVYKTSMRWIS